MHCKLSILINPMQLDYAILIDEIGCDYVIEI